MGSEKRSSVYVFGDFEADPQAITLRRSGFKIVLQEKVFQLLVSLLERHNELVSREELRSDLWPAGTYVDFDHNLNNAIAKLRAALADPAERQLYIETVGSRGYRFTAPVNKVNRGGDLKSCQERIRIAVLPFQELNGGTRHDYISEGLTEDVITSLGHLFPHRLGVIARISVLKYAGTKKTVTQIGRELRVSYILEGTVRVLQDLAHITAQLVSVSDQTQIWAATYNCRLGESFSAQGEVAEQIAQTLGLELLNEDSGGAVSRTPTDPEAYKEYLKGRYYQGKRTGESLREGVRHFQKSVELDPQYAPAYAALAISYGLLGWGGLSGASPAEFFPQAKSFAVQALTLDDNLAESHTALAIVKYQYEWDFRATERLIRQAIHLNPSDAYAHQLHSYYLISKGQHEDAILASRRARELDPLSLSANIAVGIAYFMARRIPEALAEFQSAIDLDANCALACMCLATASSFLGQTDKSMETFRQARRLDPNNARILAWFGEAAARMGQIDAAEEAMRELEWQRKHRYVCPVDEAFLYAGFCRLGDSFRCLEKAFEEHAPILVLFLRADPRFDVLRTDPRMQNLLERLRLC